MIIRQAAETLRKMASQFPAVGIIGPRQSGKTTLAKMTFPEKEYVSFDDADVYAAALKSPQDFLLAFPDGAIIDEAQKLPAIFDAVKFNIDGSKYQPGKFILTGSSKFKLHVNMSDSLAGRAAFLRLLPLSIAELRQANLLPEVVFDLILRGQYAPMYDVEKHFDSRFWYSAYIDTYIDLDVKHQINQSNVSVFRKFLQICAQYSGGLLSMNSLSKDAGVSVPTVKNWLSILEDSYVIHLLESNYSNLGKRLTKTPKLYFCDTGLLCHLLRIYDRKKLLLGDRKGALVETLAISELLKQGYNRGVKPNLSFYRDVDGFEIDAIVEETENYAVEIKSVTNDVTKLTKNIQKYIELRKGDAKGMVYYLGDVTTKSDDVSFVSWRDWGRGLE